jgi:hypothetical protein
MAVAKPAAGRTIRGGQQRTQNTHATTHRLQQHDWNRACAQHASALAHRAGLGKCQRFTREKGTFSVRALFRCADWMRQLTRAKERGSARAVCQQQQQ